MDRIIDRCWTAWYDSVKDLADAATHLPGATDMGAATAFSTDYCAQKRGCCRLVQEGLLEMDSVSNPKKEGYEQQREFSGAL